MKRFTEEQNKEWQAGLPTKKISTKVILKSDKGNILLVKPNYKETWQMPGGGAEAHEDPKLAAVREVKEETGLIITINDLRLIDSAFKAEDDFLFLIFEYKGVCPESADYSAEDKEIEGYKFVAPNEVASLLAEYYGEFWKKFVNK